MLNINCTDREEQVKFAVELFDPGFTGFVRCHQFEKII